MAAIPSSSLCRKLRQVGEARKEEDDGVAGIPAPNGLIGGIIIVTIGAVILVWISHMIRDV